MKQNRASETAYKKKAPSKAEKLKIPIAVEKL